MVDSYPEEVDFYSILIVLCKSARHYCIIQTMLASKVRVFNFDIFFYCCEIVYTAN